MVGIDDLTSGQQKIVSYLRDHKQASFNRIENRAEGEMGKDPLKKAIYELLDDDIIERSESPLGNFGDNSKSDSSKDIESQSFTLTDEWENKLD